MILIIHGHPVALESKGITYDMDTDIKKRFQNIKNNCDLSSLYVLQSEHDKHD